MPDMIARKNESVAKAEDEKVVYVSERYALRVNAISFAANPMKDRPMVEMIQGTPVAGGTVQENSQRPIANAGAAR